MSALMIPGWEQKNAFRFPHRNWKRFAVDYYRRAVLLKEEMKMPDSGLSTQRRSLRRALIRTQQIRKLTCFICACTKLDDGQEKSSAITLSASHSKLMCNIYFGLNPEAIQFNMSMAFFRRTYTEGSNAEPWRNDAECLFESWEWRRTLRLTWGRKTEDVEVLCNPEDIEYCCDAHERDKVVCKECRIAV